MEVNRFIHDIGYQVPPKVARIPEFRRFTESLLALATPIMEEAILGYPPFDGCFSKGEIIYLPRATTGRFARCAAKGTRWLLWTNDNLAGW
jgi:hypothetical protein